MNDLRFFLFISLSGIIALVEIKEEKCPPVIPKESTLRLILVTPSEIHFLRFIIEA
jgi:hypothetical protein